MAGSLTVMLIQSITAVAGLGLLYLLYLIGSVVISNLLDRRAIEKAGYHVPRLAGYTWFKGHLDYFKNNGSTFTSVVQTLKRKEDIPATFAIYISVFRTLLVSTDPEIAYQLLLKKNYPKDSYDSITPIVGKGLLTTGGDDWTKKRRIMNHGFKPSVLENMVPAFAHYSNLMCDGIVKELASRPEGKEHDWIDMAEWMSKVTLDIIGDVGFGHKFNFTVSDPSDASKQKIKEVVYTCLNEPSKQLTNPIRFLTHPRQTYEYHKALAQFLGMGMEIVKKAKAKAASGKDDGESNILSLIVKMGQLNEEDKLSDQEMLDEAMTFLIAGHETTASTASFSLLYLAKHPKVLEKAIAEVDSILPTRDSVCGYAEQAKMEYLGATLKEILRMHPIAPAALRMIPAGEEVDGKVLDREIGMLVPYTALHRNKKLWGEDADEFKPERWLGESPIKHTFAYLPFSGGPRICIGKDFAGIEFRVLMATMLRRFRYSVPRDVAYRDSVLPGDPDFNAESGDRSAKPIGFDIAFSEAVTQRPRECVLAMEVREK